jgi:Na+-transporting NADH:ubiquinone oxidoreductase subunit C
MSKDSPRNAFLVVMITAIVCSSLVSAAVVVLRPIQLNNQMLDRSRNIMQLTGLLPDDQAIEDEQMLELYKTLDVRIVNIDEADFNGDIDPVSFDSRRAPGDPDLGVAIPSGQDLASLGRRSRFAPVYMVWDDDELDRLILPVQGNGMWSMLYGYIALEPDMNTISGMTFYEQNETPGLGDQITHGHWLEQWKGRQIYGFEGNPRFRINEGVVTPDSATAQYEVDALTGATVTGDAVTSMVHYWFGPHGYQDFLLAMREQPAKRPTEQNGENKP